MTVDCLRGDGEVPGDLLGPVAPGQQTKHFQLARGQTAWALDRGRFLPEGLGDCPHHCRVESPLSRFGGQSRSGLCRRECFPIGAWLDLRLESVRRRQQPGGRGQGSDVESPVVTRTVHTLVMRHGDGADLGEKW